MNKLLLIASLLFLSSVSQAWEVDVCGIIGLSKPYEFGQWNFEVNGMKMRMSGGIQRCHSESQMRTYALEICEEFGGIIDGKDVAGNVQSEAELSQACFQWAKQSDFTAYFTCDKGEESCASQKPQKVILQGWN